MQVVDLHKEDLLPNPLRHFNKVSIRSPSVVQCMYYEKSVLSMQAYIKYNLPDLVQMSVIMEYTR